jgi:hypothetical protein
MDNSHVTVVRTLYVVMEAVVWDSRLANGFMDWNDDILTVGVRGLV